MAQLKSTNVTGNLSVTGNILASKIIKLGGTEDEILLANGGTTTLSGLGAGTVTSVGLTVPTGLTVTGSPITGSGTFAVTYTEGYAIPTTADQTKWNTAHGWGNHADAGYLTSQDLANYLPLAGNTTTTLMTGSIKYGGKTQEIISIAPEYQSGSWKGGMKYSWDSKTTIALWGKNADCQFVWHAGADLSTGATDGWANRNYDFQIGRNSSSTLEALLGGKPLATQEWVQGLGYTGAPDLSNYVEKPSSSTTSGLAYFTDATGKTLGSSATTISSAGLITVPVKTGIAMSYTAGGDDVWLYPKGADTYGIRYFEGSPDAMAFSATANNRTQAGADLCINGNGDGTVTMRGKNIATEEWVTTQLSSGGSMDLNNYLPLSGGTMTEEGPIKYNQGGGGPTYPNNYISAGRGYSPNSGRYGIKVVACDQNDCVSGMGQDLLNGTAQNLPYDFGVAGSADSTNRGFISFCMHKYSGTNGSTTAAGEITAKTYHRVGIFDYSGKFGTRSTICAPAVAITSGDATNCASNEWTPSIQATWQYNSSTDCVELVW